MTVKDLIEKAKASVEGQVYKYYSEVICEGDNPEEIENYIEELKADGTWGRECKHQMEKNLFSIIDTIKKTDLMTTEQKEQAIEEVKSCPEYNTMEKEVAMLFANHFYKYRDAYLK